MKAKTTHFVLFCISFVLFYSITEASIVYSGKLNLTGPDFSLDINEDGVTDFESGWRWRGGGGYISFSSYDVVFNNSFSMRYLNDGFEPSANSGMPGLKVPLDYGTLIGPSAPPELMWSFSSNDGMMWNKYDFYADPQDSYSGAWNNLQNKYLGFELNDGTGIYYGWIQFDTDKQNNITLIDYAYESVSNTAILAGASQVPVPSSFVFLFTGLFLLCYARLNKRMDWSRRTIK